MQNNELTICEYCNGDKAVFYRNPDNCAFIDRMGEMEIYIEGKSIQFSVDYCPKCGRAFHEPRGTFAADKESHKA